MTKSQQIFKFRFVNTMFDFANEKQAMTRYEVENIVKILHRYQATLQRLFTDDCNFGNSPERAKKETKVIKAATFFANALNVELEIQGDPRGLPFIFKKNGLEYRMEF